jgi:hypothetical protein
MAVRQRCLLLQLVKVAMVDETPGQSILPAVELVVAVVVVQLAVMEQTWSAVLVVLD